MLTCVFENGNKNSLRHVVTDILVIKGGKILLVKRAKELLEGGKWAVAGGFVDRDETIAKAATREVMEETGWQIKDLTLLTVIDKPDRPNEDRQNISFVYFCEATKQTGKPDWESDEQKWFDLDKLPSKETMAFDHLESIRLYKEQLKA